MEAERVVRRAEVVIHRLGNAHTVEPARAETVSAPQSVFTPERDERLQPQLPCVVQAELDGLLILDRVRARRFQHGSALGNDGIHQIDCQRSGEDLPEALPSLTDSDEIVPEYESSQHDPSDRRVQARTVSAAGQHSDSHLRFLLLRFIIDYALLRSGGALCPTNASRSARCSSGLATPTMVSPGSNSVVPLGSKMWSSRMIAASTHSPGR